MKKLSLLVALALLITVGGVYATWTYTQTTDVADESVNIPLNLTSVVHSDGYGAYVIDQSTLALKVEPKPGTTHTTALTISGELVVTFTPSTFAPVEVKENGVPSTFAFSLSNNSWKFDDGHDDGDTPLGDRVIIKLNHTELHNITWVKQGNGTFIFTLDATALQPHFTLTEFTLDTKALYDAYNTALGNGQIVFTVSDGQHA